jgi:hypothetical protein
MVDGILSFGDGQLSLGGRLVPGILQSMTIAGQVRFDKAEQDGMSGKVKVPLGWEDADITLVVELLTEESSTCYSKLDELNRIFKGTDNGGNPKIYDVVNPHALARGIERVVFSGLSSQETDQDDVISANLSFVEHVPPVTRVEARQAAKTTGGAPATTAADPKLDRRLTVDLS